MHHCRSGAERACAAPNSTSGPVGPVGWAAGGAALAGPDAAQGSAAGGGGGQVSMLVLSAGAGWAAPDEAGGGILAVSALRVAHPAAGCAAAPAGVAAAAAEAGSGAVHDNAGEWPRCLDHSRWNAPCHVEIHCPTRDCVV